jgi:hypothetical protein
MYGRFNPEVSQFIGITPLLPPELLQLLNSWTPSFRNSFLKRWRIWRNYFMSSSV